MHNKIYISRRKQLIILDGGSAFVVKIHAYNSLIRKPKCLAKFDQNGL